jgi:hypothetical protein
VTRNNEVIKFFSRALHSKKGDCYWVSVHLCVVGSACNVDLQVRVEIFLSLSLGEKIFVFLLFELELLKEPLYNFIYCQTD